MAVRNVFYAQSGGVTAVINASACGVIQSARAYPDRLGRVFAGRNGILGALEEDLIDTSLESDADIAALRRTPAGAFGSCRYKLKGLEENRAEYERLIDVFRAHDIGYFLYNGGGDSADTCLKVAQMGERLGYPLQAIHIPKTVDNDLPHTDTCPGFGSAAKYIATSVREAGFDVASMARTSTRIFVLEVMGRHAGWLAAAAGLAHEQDEDAPHLLLLPEIPLAEDALMERVEATVQRHGYCVVVVSEGLRTADGQFVAESGTRDAFGHAQLGGVAPRIAERIRERLGHKYHWAVADYLQRAARHLASATDVAQAYAVGQAAVDLALKGVSGRMVSLVRKTDSPYVWTTGDVALEEVAGRECPLPREYISEDGFGITPACRRHLAPLLEGEDYPEYVRGLPRYVRLAGHRVPPRLSKAFKIT
jgi:6-phosphofructokinase 1